MAKAGYELHVKKTGAPEWKELTDEQIDFRVELVREGLKTIAQVGFEAYSKNAGGKTWDGKDIPKWEDVGEKVQSNHMAMALAIIEFLEQAHAFSNE